ncbi:hypothetical protein M514_10778 [Trichuris suis]|uniref:Uncharacterized protein n=1 Tax=Trichuris suis TaxID=68888 RepID=A0A085MYI9_9BILA|nr:hypothetical protein M513_10778 [Trichuris suis]KFD62285.1 hypothetical protein M514_10778 [Trichuris suis]
MNNGTSLLWANYLNRREVPKPEHATTSLALFASSMLFNNLLLGTSPTLPSFELWHNFACHQLSSDKSQRRRTSRLDRKRGSLQGKDCKSRLSDYSRTRLATRLAFSQPDESEQEKPLVGS